MRRLKFFLVINGLTIAFLNTAFYLGLRDVLKYNGRVQLGMILVGLISFFIGMVLKKGQTT